MKVIQHFFLLTLQSIIKISTSTKILYVLPDNLANASCPMQPCGTLNQYMLENGTLPIVSDVEYHLLPGEHHVPTKIILEHLDNFALIGSIGNVSSILVLVNNIQMNMQISESFNVTIANVVFTRDNPHSLQNMKLYNNATNLLLSTCYYCKIENVIFLKFGLIGDNLIGISHLNNIVIYLNTDADICHKGILLQYQNGLQRNDVREFVVTINNISVHDNTNVMGCHNYDAFYTAGIVIMLYQTIFDVTIVICNSQLNDIGQTLLLIKDTCNPANNSVQIKNCTFQFRDSLDAYTIRLLIVVELSQFKMTLIFIDCKFYNFKGSDLITIIASHRTWCEVPNWCTFPTNITFRGCSFINNLGSSLRVTTNDKTFLCRVNLYIIGPFSIYGSSSNKSVNNYIIHTSNTAVLIDGPLYVLNSTAKYIFRMEFCQAFFNGPITISNNYRCSHVIQFYCCEILFNKEIEFRSNKCEHIITLETNPEDAYINLLEYSSIKFTNNSYNNLIAVVADKSIPYPPCLFQYVSLRNGSNIPTEHYSINVKDNIYTSCMVIFLDYTSHCKWLYSSRFYGYNSKTINQEIIQVNNKKFNQHTIICHCLNCSIDTLGPVYPGQSLNVELCVPCSDHIAILYAETHNTLLPNSVCKIAHQTELISVITNFSKKVNFTIVSEASHKCELLLTVSPYLYHVYEAFLFNYYLVQLDLHYKMECVTVIHIFQLILIHAVLISPPLDALPICG